MSVLDTNPPSPLTYAVQATAEQTVTVVGHLYGAWIMGANKDTPPSESVLA
jgi:hypothetical protein